MREMVLFEEEIGNCGLGWGLCVQNGLILRNIYQLCVYLQAQFRKLGEKLLLLYGKLFKLQTEYLHD